MTYLVETVTSLNQAQALGRITAQSFNITEPGWVEQFVETQSWQNLCVIQSQDQVMGGLKIYPMGQWFG
ncbi:MAG: hypothetical protein SFW36_20250, partial [Leptolyngbyaceae cyanobacterium bins.59]|nr:hypothetical protein [Leptolyngbyaceae cyanobacterium bins.59]